MGIVSQLRDAQGGDTDMGTLADLLRGLAEGRNIDSTPFGMWGVRDMDPKSLGLLMNQASNVHQENLAKQMDLLGKSTTAGADFLGRQEIAEAQKYSADVGAKTAANSLRAAPDAARLAAEAAQKRAETTGYYGMEGHKATGEAHIKAAQIAAEGKNEKTVPWAPMVAAQVAAQLGGLDKLKPKEQAALLEKIIMLGEMNKYETAPLKEKLANLRSGIGQEPEAKSWLSGLSSPAPGPVPDTIDVYNPNAYKPPPPDPNSAYEKWKRETALQGY